MLLEIGASIAVVIVLMFFHQWSYINGVVLGVLVVTAFGGRLFHNENVRHRIATSNTASSVSTTVVFYAAYSVVISGVFVFVAALLNDSFVETFAGFFATLLIGLTALMMIIVRRTSSTKTEG